MSIDFGSEKDRMRQCAGMSHEADQGSGDRPLRMALTPGTDTPNVPMNDEDLEGEVQGANVSDAGSLEAQLESSR
jgi:hypothetical protein